MRKKLRLMVTISYPENIEASVLASDPSWILEDAQNESHEIYIEGVELIKEEKKEAPWDFKSLGDLTDEVLSKEFSDVSFAKLSRITKRAYIYLKKTFVNSPEDLEDLKEYLSKQFPEVPQEKVSGIVDKVLDFINKGLC